MKKSVAVKRLTKVINRLRPTIIHEKKLEWLEGTNGRFQKRVLIFHSDHEVEDFIRYFKRVIPFTVDATLKQKGQIFNRDIQSIFFRTLTAIYDSGTIMVVDA